MEGRLPQRRGLRADEAHRQGPAPGGIVQGVLKEPEGGAHTDWAATFRTVDAALRHELAALDKLSPLALVQQRYQMFRAMGRDLPPAGEEEV